MKSPIIVDGDPVLRSKAKPVPLADIKSKSIASIIKKMSDALRATSDGIGIAAPQIGVPLRIFLASEEALAIDAANEQEPIDPKKKWQYFVFINPEIIKTSAKKIKSTEGCLSVPGQYGLVSRAEKVRIRAYDETGKKFERGASHLFARLMQHETDHLNGVLYIDRAQKMFHIL